MKKILSIIAIAALLTAVFASCSNDRVSNATSQIKYEDTVGLAEFQAWKVMNERANAMYAYQAQNNHAATAAPVKRVRHQSSSGRLSSSSTNYAKTTAPTTTKKKGWSKAAKYSVIGGGGGAILGAVINKRNRVAGGVVGGVLGGGLGYVLGRAQDKKDGRY